MTDDNATTGGARGAQGWAAVGAACGLLAVALGAFGAHGLKELLERLGTAATWETAVLYHLVHAPMVFVLGLRGGRSSARAALLFVVGVAIFSGTLYLLSVTGVRWLGAITPIGGVALMLGWLSLAVDAWRGRL